MDRGEVLTINLPYSVEFPATLVNNKPFPLSSDEMTSICGEATIT
jgi:hypothetical protein